MNRPQIDKVIFRYLRNWTLVTLTLIGAIELLCAAFGHGG